MNKPQESLIDQRERLMRQILGQAKYAKRIEFMDSIKPKHKQLKLFI